MRPLRCFRTSWFLTCCKRNEVPFVEYNLVRYTQTEGVPNACNENFFATLKMEWVYHRKYCDLEHLDGRLFAYGELFYNRKLLHSKIARAYMI